MNCFEDIEEAVVLDDISSMLKEFEVGTNQIRVCLGTACHVRGGDMILENFEHKLEKLAGEIMPDWEISIDRLACLGYCASAPVAIGDDTACGHMSPSKVERLILGFKLEKEWEGRERREGESEH